MNFGGRHRAGPAIVQGTRVALRRWERGALPALSRAVRPLGGPAQPPALPFPPQRHPKIRRRGRRGCGAFLPPGRVADRAHSRHGAAPTCELEGLAVPAHPAAGGDQRRRVDHGGGAGAAQ